MLANIARCLTDSISPLYDRSDLLKTAASLACTGSPGTTLLSRHLFSHLSPHLGGWVHWQRRCCCCCQQFVQAGLQRRQQPRFDQAAGAARGSAGSNPKAGIKLGSWGTGNLECRQTAATMAPELKTSSLRACLQGIPCRPTLPLPRLPAPCKLSPLDGWGVGIVGQQIKHVAKLTRHHTVGRRSESLHKLRRQTTENAQGGEGARDQCRCRLPCHCCCQTCQDCLPELKSAGYGRPRTERGGPDEQLSATLAWPHLPSYAHPPLHPAAPHFLPAPSPPGAPGRIGGPPVRSLRAGGRGS